MKFKNKEAWDKGVKKNTDPYGAAVYIYAQQWANLMEEKVKKGHSIEKIAKDLSHEADTEGITGFMYGCAVSILAKCWIHGEELRQWHNLDTQIGNEGEKANKSSSVLNPAIITISTKEK
jgi:hypothetical protein